jgi:hypothetical protein
MVKPERKWPNGVVYYEIEDSFCKYNQLPHLCDIQGQVKGNVIKLYTVYICISIVIVG